MELYQYRSGVSINSLKDILRKAAFHIHNFSLEKRAIMIKNKNSDLAYYSILIMSIDYILPKRLGQHYIITSHCTLFY